MTKRSMAKTGGLLVVNLVAMSLAPVPAARAAIQEEVPEAAGQAAAPSRRALAGHTFTPAPLVRDPFTSTYLPGAHHRRARGRPGRCFVPAGRADR